MKLLLWKIIELLDEAKLDKQQSFELIDLVIEEDNPTNLSIMLEVLECL